MMTYVIWRFIQTVFRITLLRISTAWYNHTRTIVVFYLGWYSQTLTTTYFTQKTIFLIIKFFFSDFFMVGQKNFGCVFKKKKTCLRNRTHFLVCACKMNEIHSVYAYNWNIEIPMYMCLLQYNWNGFVLVTNFCRCFPFI